MFSCAPTREVVAGTRHTGKLCSRPGVPRGKRDVSPGKMYIGRRRPPIIHYYIFNVYRSGGPQQFLFTYCTLTCRKERSPTRGKMSSRMPPPARRWRASVSDGGNLSVNIGIFENNKSDEAGVAVVNAGRNLQIACG